MSALLATLAADQPDLQKLEKPHWHIDLDQPDFGPKGLSNYADFVISARISAPDFSMKVSYAPMLEPKKWSMHRQGDHRWVKLHEESLDFHPRFFPVFEEKREN